VVWPLLGNSTISPKADPPGGDGTRRAAQLSLRSPVLV
jgi:hypothetical protein